MSPLEVQAILAAANGAIQLLQALGPTLTALENSKDIDDATQAQVRATNDAYRALPTGPEWKLSTDQ